jgi:hypothetical protein
MFLDFLEQEDCGFLQTHQKREPVDLAEERAYKVPPKAAVPSGYQSQVYGSKSPPSVGQKTRLIGHVFPEGDDADDYTHEFFDEVHPGYQHHSAPPQAQLPPGYQPEVPVAPTPQNDGEFINLELAEEFRRNLGMDYKAFENDDL